MLLLKSKENEFLIDLGDSDLVASSIVQIDSYFLNKQIKGQISGKKFDSNRFKLNPPQHRYFTRKGSKILVVNGNTYVLRKQDLVYFLPATTFEKSINYTSVKVRF